MRHARAEALDELADILDGLRAMPALKEKSRGTFYRSSRAFLHFHEDPTGLYADVRLSGDDFDRCRVSTPAERADLLRRVTAALA